MNEISKESAFLITNASGRHINLLNDSGPIAMSVPSPPSSDNSDENTSTVDAVSTPTPVESSSSKRKYHCTEPGCAKSFTTSGHLARHNRIHTGEKNFPCLFPGCLSRFSRQDNMMQHYRTHMSPKSKRTQKKVITEDLHPRPRLHAHQRIRSDPYRVERPLTIDQHLNNYRRSLLSHPSTVERSSLSSVKYNMPTPLGAVAASHMQKQQLQQNEGASAESAAPTSRRNSNGTWSIEPVGHESSLSYTRREMEEPNCPSSPPSPSAAAPLSLAAEPSTEHMFYQHRPLTYSRPAKKRKIFPFTLLHPTGSSETIQQKEPGITTPSLASTSPTSSMSTSLSSATGNSSANADSDGKGSSQAGLLQLAHIVSTFG
ncbi:hypothetical protein V8B55DRAFT_1442365 [Mucor lusitanicus]|uniref:C2H2-type domain-containing protein n=1 Tax=Mucor circinelloides f. lusitanicus TaxID=29924 RepID=A0A8H4F4W5_MUCCL|nr:hypothetical protein FB192DRAFT_1004361 [Mucor lusitanicus]